MSQHESGVNPQRGEVWRVQLDTTLGDEMGKTRPAVVMNVAEVGRLALRIVVPLTGWRPEFTQWPWMVPLVPIAKNGL